MIIIGTESGKITCTKVRKVLAPSRLKLNQSTDEFKTFWNGRMNPLRIAYVKNTENEMRIAVECVACGKRWTFSYNDVERFINDHKMRFRLLKLCQEYWWEVHDDHQYSGYKMVDVVRKDGKTKTIILSTDPETQDWFVTCNDVLKCNGDFDECMHVFLAVLNAQ